MSVVYEGYTVDTHILLQVYFCPQTNHHKKECWLINYVLPPDQSPPPNGDKDYSCHTMESPG